MARVQFRPRRASGTFFPVSPYRPFWGRVRVRVRVGGSSVVLPCFPWRASSSVHDGRRALFSRVHVPLVLGPCTGPCMRRWFWPVFHGARPAPATTGVGHFFPVSTYRPFWVRVRVGGSSVVLACFPWRASSSVQHGRRALFFPCPRTGRSGSVYASVARRGLFSLARVQFRPRRASGTFFPCPRTARSGSVYGSVYASVPRRWFCPVYHGARPVPSSTDVGYFFPVSTYRSFWVRVRVRVRVGASSVV